MGRLYTWRAQYKAGRRKAVPPTATEWRRRYVPEPIRRYLALSPAEVEHLDDLLIRTERAFIATWNLPDLPDEVTALQTELGALTQQLDAWLKPAGPG